MRVAIIGGGTIARLFLDHIRRGDLGRARVVAIVGRSDQSKGRQLAKAYRVPFVLELKALLAKKPDVVVEAASHDAVREYGGGILRKRIALIVLSGGAFSDDALRVRLERTAMKSGALLYVPSGGIGGLDALKAACVAGVDEVTIAVTKPPPAWKGIPYVERLGIDLDSLREPRTLFEGSARAGVPLFPANVNIAAVLSMAGIGFDRTRLKVVAVPGLKHNTHFIEIKGPTGNISVKLENVPAPDNPRTAWLACYSALAALKAVKAPVRYGT
ncbi:MAG: aspartate dehydrogenase [Gammaproteobacteria bacterium]|nr:aspartate dehydrogenase [Gammaproteobacteria bacterium]MDH3411474.1 aspartate dehydrogenase [Gammaproteobacteria bacterium]